MLIYTGSMCMDGKYNEILNICKELVELCEKIYCQNIIDFSKSCTTITNEEIIKKLKTANTQEKLMEVIKENKILHSQFIKKLFNRLLGDFCLYMYDSLKAVFDFKPQIAFTLARKPLIDDVFYLQYLYKRPHDCIDLVFSNISKDKDVGTRKNREIDETLSKEIAKEFNYEEDIILDLRLSDSVYSIKHNCDKSLHIATSTSKIENTIQGELNFVFMQDEEIKSYIERYLNVVPIVLFYIAELILKINERFFAKIEKVQEKLQELQEKYTKLNIE